jgi:hypothetical protein
MELHARILLIKVFFKGLRIELTSSLETLFGPRHLIVKGELGPELK